MNDSKANKSIEENTSLNSSLSHSAGFTMILEPYPLTVIRLTLFGILFVTAIVGNACVFLAPWRNARLRTFSYSLITCLAVGDFISALSLPFTLVTEHLHSRWIFGKALCHFLNPTQVVCGMVTTNVHTAISVDRCVSVISPFKGKPKGTKKRLIIALIWLTAVLCALPSFGAHRMKLLYLPNGQTLNVCIEAFPAHKYAYMYSLFLMVVNYTLPILIMSIMYTSLVLKLHSAGKFRDEHSTSLHGGAKTDIEKKFIRMAFLIMVLFALCYLPYQVLYLLMNFDVMATLSYGFLLFKYAHLLTWVPNALNPIVYGKMDLLYLKAYKRIFRC
ncbi:predicted protein, partial [Nematostella vectensis]